MLLCVHDISVGQLIIVCTIICNFAHCEICHMSIVAPICWKGEDKNVTKCPFAPTNGSYCVHLVFNADIFPVMLLARG